MALLASVDVQINCECVPSWGRSGIYPANSGCTRTTLSEDCDIDYHWLPVVSWRLGNLLDDELIVAHPTIVTYLI